MKRLRENSQNFLRNPRLVAELIGHSNIRRDDTVYDLGAGSGVISAVLADKVANVVAVESDDRLVERLRSSFAGSDNVRVVDGDILEVPLPPAGYKVCANIPFHISSPVVRRLTCSDDTQPEAIYLIVQRQFARKLVIGGDNFTSQLGAMIAPWWSVRIRRPLKRSDFSPPPRVDTVFLEILPRPTPLLDRKKHADYESFVERSFHFQKIFSQLPREKLGISSEKKPSELTVDEWVRLYDAR